MLVGIGTVRYRVSYLKASLVWPLTLHNVGLGRRSCAYQFRKPNFEVPSNGRCYIFIYSNLSFPL